MNTLGQNDSALNRFADVSSIAGIDFPEDGRGIAITDWDSDGDPDFWISNRSSPQVRFLNNDVGNRNHYVALHLTGTKSNRDAIGATVELTLADQSELPIFKSIHAGDGFLSQSSKWILVGCGASKTISALKVVWPSGGVQLFDDLEIDRHYRIVEGDPIAKEWFRPDLEENQVAVSPAVVDSPPQPADARVRNFLADKLPLPSFYYYSWEAAPESVFRDRPTAVVLWLPSCGSCIKELREVTQSADQLRNANIDVLALTVQPIKGPGDPAIGQSQALLEKMEFPFRSGIASPAMIEQLQIAIDQLFETRRALGVPATFLIDGQGKLNAIYQGKFPVQQWLDDFSLSVATRSLRERTSLPFPGRWHQQVRISQLFPITWQLLEKGHLEAGMEYVRHYSSNLSRNPRYSSLLTLAGAMHLSQKMPQQAKGLYELALQAKSDDVEAINNLAYLLASSANRSLRDPDRSLSLAKKAVEITDRRSATMLDTLATAQAATGDFTTACGTAREAYDRAMRTQQHGLAGDIQKRLKLYENNMAIFE